MFLTACNLDDSNVVVQIVCPRINEYDVKTQDRALAEYNSLPPDSALRLFIGDYKQLRDQVRVCRGEKLSAASHNSPANGSPLAPPRPSLRGLTFKDRWHEGVKTYATVFR